MRQRIFLLVASSLLANAVTAPLAAEDRQGAAQPPMNLIVNGSFEEGPEPDAFLPLDPGSPAIKGWTVTKAQIDYIGTHWKAADGKRSLDMNGSPGFGGIQQSFKTKKGQKYVLSFYFSANPGSQGGERALAVRVGDKREVYKVDPAGIVADNMGWATRILQFTAQDDMTTLEFFSADEADPFSGPALDNVFVYEVKDPQK